MELTILMPCLNESRTLKICIDKAQKFLSDNNIEVWVGAGVTQISKLKSCLDNGAKLITTNNPADIKNKLVKLGKY